jgi:hypothetical protein
MIAIGHTVDISIIRLSWSHAVKGTIIIFALSIILAGYSWGHSDELNSSGCHNQSGSSYHCHGGGSSSSSSYSRFTSAPRSKTTDERAIEESAEQRREMSLYLEMSCGEFMNRMKARSLPDGVNYLSILVAIDDYEAKYILNNQLISPTLQMFEVYCNKNPNERTVNQAGRWALMARYRKEE